MFRKINIKSIINSFYLGLFIGAFIQIILTRATDVLTFSMTILLSGIIGLVIGLTTELLTSMIPISIAEPKIYFFLNNLIALIVSVTIFGLGRSLLKSALSYKGYLTMIIIICGIVSLANLVDYYNYKRANFKLKIYKRENQ